MRGDGRIYKQKGSSILWCAYYLRGEQHRESTGETDEAKAGKYLKRRLLEVGADRIGGKQFVGPKAERIKISCGVLSPGQRKADCECLCCALERDFRLRDMVSAPNLSHLKRVREDFALRRAMSLTAETIDRYIELRISEGATPATINRSTQMLGQAFKLAIQQKRLISAPFIRHLSEIGNARQGFYTKAEFEAIRGNLPEDLKDFALFGYLTGMRSGQIKSLLWEDIDGDVIRSRAENVKTRKAHSIELAGDLQELIERRRTARQVIRADGTVMLAPYVFHRNGQPIIDFRKSWQTACVMVGLGKFLCRDCEDVELEAGRKCPKCEKKWTKVQPKYAGQHFHDFRRTAVRDMVRAGIPESVAMSISGHSTPSIFKRYDITDGRDQREALHALKAYREQQAATQREKVAAMPQRSTGVQ